MADEMKYALYGLHRHADGPEVLARQARAAEEAGLEGLWVGDHVALPRGPVQAPHPPIVVGGHSPAALRRAARHGNGWYGWRLDVDDAAQAVSALREAVRVEERPSALGPVEVSVTPPGPVSPATARRYAEVGVHRLVLQPDGPGPAAMDSLIDTSASLVGRH